MVYLIIIKLTIFGRSLHQPEYKILKAGFKDLLEPEPTKKSLSQESLTKENIISILNHNEYGK